MCVRVCVCGLARGPAPALPPFWTQVLAWLRQEGGTSGAIFLGCKAPLPCSFHRTGHLAEETRAVWCVLRRGSRAGHSRGPMLGPAAGLPALLPHTGLGGRARPAHGAVQRLVCDPRVKNLSGLSSLGPIFQMAGALPPTQGCCLSPPSLPSSPLSSYFVFLRRRAPLSPNTNESAKQPFLYKLPYLGLS